MEDECPHIDLSATPRVKRITCRVGNWRAHAATGPLPPQQQARRPQPRRLDHGVVRDDYGGGGGRDIVPGGHEGQEQGRFVEGHSKGRKKAVAFTATEDMETIEEERTKPNVMLLLPLMMKMMPPKPLIHPQLLRSLLVLFSAMSIPQNKEL